MKFKWIVLVLVLAMPVSAYAQTVQVRRGSPMFFEHDDSSVLVTERYEICEDQVDDAHCKAITDIVKIGSSGGLSTFQYRLPDGVTNGTHMYAMRAFGEGEWSDPSNNITLKITGKPLPPQNFRITPPTNPTTMQSTSPPPAVVR